MAYHNPMRNYQSKEEVQQFSSSSTRTSASPSSADQGPSGDPEVSELSRTLQNIHLSQANDGRPEMIHWSESSDSDPCGLLRDIPEWRKVRKTPSLNTLYGSQWEVPLGHSSQAEEEEQPAGSSAKLDRPLQPKESPFRLKADPKKHPLPERFTPEEFENWRINKIREAIFPNSETVKLRDEDLDIPEVAAEFDKVYPLLLPPLTGVCYNRGKNRLHRARWVRKALWDQFWRNSVTNQLAMIESRPNLKIFFDAHLGRDAFHLIRNFRDRPVKRPSHVLVYNELDLMPEGFPSMLEGGDPYLSVQTYNETKAKIPKELDVDTLVRAARQYHPDPPIVSLEELVGPTPFYEYDGDDTDEEGGNVVGHKTKALDNTVTIDIPNSQNYPHPFNYPDPTPEQVQKLMELGDCGWEEAVEWWWNTVCKKYNKNKTDKVKAEEKGQARKKRVTINPERVQARRVPMGTHR